MLIASVLGLGRDARIADESEARELAGHVMYGFAAADIAIDAAGRGALLQDPDGRIVLLAPHGAHFTASLLDATTAHECDGSRVTIAGTCLDLGGAAGAWEMRLNALDS